MSQPAVIFGGPSPEHDVSVLTGLQAVRALSSSGGVLSLYWSKSNEWFEVDTDLEAADFAEGVPRRSRPVRLVVGTEGGFVARGGGLLGKERPLDVSAVVNCCHGGPGEDGTLQAVLDLAGVAYTGPTMAGAALGMDKLAFGGVVTAAGLPSLPRAVVGPPLGPGAGFGGPLIVKPRYGGSSIGIEVVEDHDTAQALARTSPHLRAGAVVEPYRPQAADVNVAVRTWPELALSAIEKPLRGEGSGILGYADKYVGGQGMVSAPRQLPAELPEPVEKQVRDLAAQIATLAGVRGVARIDFLLDGGELYVNEMNTIPGSLSKHLWIDPPLPFDTLLSYLLEEAARRPAHHYSTAGADGTALRSAGRIASKLA